MNEVPCVIAGCYEVFKTEEIVSKSARFVCKNHPRDVQVRVSGRVYNPNTDEADREVRFQAYQHDRDLNNATKPETDTDTPENVGAHTHAAIPSRSIIKNLDEERMVDRIDEAREAS